MTIAPLHVVTDDDVLGREDFLSVATAVLEVGGAELALHVRGPRSEGAVVHRLAAELLPAARAAGAALLVNDRVDVALLTGADGAHLGRRSLPTPVARALMGPEACLGVSVRGADAASAARDEGADYAFVGTIYETPSHPAGAVQGPQAISRARAAAADLPLLGIGGVRPDRVAEVLRAGADGVAVVRGVWDSEEPGAAVERYLEALRGSKSLGQRTTE